MSRYSLILGLWPGLAGLVRYGRGIFLILAAGFGMLASITLFCCGYWTELIAPESKLWLAGGLAASWLLLTLVSAALSTLFSGQLAYDEGGDRYLMALDAYLAANWGDAEKIARAILRRNKRDPDTTLLLATLFRHTGRFDEAAEFFDRLEGMEEAGKWTREILAERIFLAREIAEAQAPEVIPFPARGKEKGSGAERRKTVGE
ncbi:MAG: tetratricopeptide repeat protein [Thermoguttaceae bacterium]|jgi:tetratricopeptide (TPR) repeat protein